MSAAETSDAARPARFGLAAKLFAILILLGAVGGPKWSDPSAPVRPEQALFALRGPSCGHCDTAIPLQRRNIMAGTGQIEVCEACGVLLYAGE